MGKIKITKEDWQGPIKLSELEKFSDSNPNLPGIYLHLIDNEVINVGETEDMLGRQSQYRDAYRKEKCFDYFTLNVRNIRKNGLRIYDVFNINKWENYTNEKMIDPENFFIWPGSIRFSGDLKEFRKYREEMANEILLFWLSFSRPKFNEIKSYKSSREYIESCIIEDVVEKNHLWREGNKTCLGKIMRNNFDDVEDFFSDNIYYPTLN